MIELMFMFIAIGLFIFVTACITVSLIAGLACIVKHAADSMLFCLLSKVNGVTNEKA